MQKLKIKLEDNPFCSSPEMTTLTNYFGFGAASLTHFGFNEYRHLFSKHNDIKYINLLLGYEQRITATTDLFKFIDSESINELRDGHTVLIFDATLEGYSETELPLKTCLYYNAALHNIDPSKIFLFTGNFLTEDDSINVIPIFLLDTGWADTTTTINKVKAECFKNLEKIILSLSRRNRFSRVVAHFALWKSQLGQDTIISQDALVDAFRLSEDIFKKLDLTADDWQQFKNALPLLADGNNFHINAPFDHLPALHSKTVFSIVNETLINSCNNTSLFFSEKLLKPIINYQPMVIYGQPGINRKIQMLGFKTYEDYFDLSFDDEPDDILRYKKLLASIESTVTHLRSMSRDEQIDWRFKQLELLEYNRQVFIRKENTMQQLGVFSRKLTSVFQNLL